MGYYSSALHVYSMVYIMPRLSLPSRLVPLIPSYYMGWWSDGESQLLSPLDHVANWPSVISFYCIGLSSWTWTASV